MGFVSRIRGILPPSSRSFHAMWEETGAKLNEVQWRVQHNEVKLEELRTIVCEQLAEIHGLQQSHVIESSTIMQSLFQKEGESKADAQKRFFSEMAPATGALRILQKANSQLLREFDELCKKNGIPYFLTTGTLLGAIRHQGPIPWDDDIDVGIEYSQLDKVVQAAKADSRYRITIAYDQNVFCKQIRFKWADDSIPCFVDLFLYDFTSGVTPENIEKYSAIRSQIIESASALKAKGVRFEGIIPESEDEAAEIEEVFAQARKMALESNLICSQDRATSMMWGLENLSSLTGADPVFPIEWIYGFGEAQYDSMTLPAPAQPEPFLRSMYGQWDALPRTMAQDITHFDFKGMTSATKNAMKAIVEESE